MGLSWIECCSKQRLVIHFIIGQFPASRRSGKIRWDWHQSIISRSLSLVMGHPKKCGLWCQKQISRAWIYIYVASLLGVLSRIHAPHAGFWCQFFIYAHVSCFVILCILAWCIPIYFSIIWTGQSWHVPAKQPLTNSHLGDVRVILKMLLCNHFHHWYFD